ncbi:MAG: nucleoid-associated protein [Bacteroidetes bacterium]|nr:MAG: nucleoid-associated protein [Bacteroidota bacterium]
MRTIDFSEARLKALAVHKVGNKAKNEGVIASAQLYEFDEIMEGVLLDYFLKAFRTDSFYKFTHEADLALNEVYTYCKQIFESIGTSELLPQSVNILNHLYAQSSHPQIKSGELCVALFDGCQIEGVMMNAIGIFKSENKDTFLQFQEEEDSVSLHLRQGVNIKKLDKGCMVFNSFADDGYSVLMVDRNSEETAYWRDDFLHILRIQDNSYHTEVYLDMAKDFCEEVIAKEADKKEQLVLMNKALNYFSKNEVYDADDFKQQVIEAPKYLPLFDEYRQSYEAEQGLQTDEGFAISKYAVRNKRKEFPSQIKLDTQIEIRFNPKFADEAGAYIERGFDEQRGMYYYKVYFNGEVD